MTIKEGKDINVKRFSSGDYLTEEEAQTIIKESEKIFRTEIDAYAAKAESITDSPDNDTLKMAKAIDASRNAQAGKSENALKAPRTGHRLNRLSHYAAVFIACLFVVGTIGAATSDAFRAKLFNVFVSEESGSITMESIPDDSPMKDWSDYWYPEYIPDGFIFTDAEESNTERIIRFDSSNSDAYILISISDGDGTTISLDFSHSEVEGISINSYDGYIAVNDEAKVCNIVWLTETQVIDLYSNGYIIKDELAKMANELQRIE